jgi:hypothetical protein
MKCEVKRRIEVNAEEKEKLLYLKRELEKKGLKVKISVDSSSTGENGKIEYLGKEMPSFTLNNWESKEINPKEIKDPYRSFKELLDGEKEKAMLELKGGGWKKGGGEPIDGMKYELKEVTIKIEVET